MSKYKAVIFDLDGTLLDTLADILAAANAMLVEFDYPRRTREEMITMIGDGVRKMIQRAVPQEIAKYDSLVNKCYNLFMEIYKRTTENTVPFTGIPELLAELAGRGIKTAVLSNKPHPEAVKIVAEKLPDHEFAIVLGASDEYPAKPDPRGITHILEVLGLSAQECLYVGDGEMDRVTPVSVGMPCVSSLWGYRTREQLESVGADRFISVPEEVLALL